MYRARVRRWVLGIRGWACMVELVISRNGLLVARGGAKEEKRKQTRRAYPRPDCMASAWGQWLQKLQELSAAPDRLDPACREARDFASHFRVSYDIFPFIMEAVKSVFSACNRNAVGRPCLPLKLKVRSSGYPACGFSYRRVFSMYRANMGLCLVRLNK